MLSILSSILSRFTGERTRFVVASRFVFPVLVAGIGSVSLFLSHATSLSGDEFSYCAKAALLSKSMVSVVQMDPVDCAAVTSRIIDFGWFMPGMGVLLTPVQLLYGGEAPVFVLRLYITLVNLVLMYLIVRELLKLGVARRYVFLSIVIPCFVPYYLFYLGMLWGDLVGVHLALFLLLQLERRILQGEQSLVPSHKGSLIVGLLLGATVLVRPQYVILPAIALVRILVQKIRSTEDASLLRSSWASVVVCLTLLVLPMIIVLAPWHYALSKKFGRSFMVTSTYMRPLFRDDDYVRSAVEEIGRHKFEAVHRKIGNDAKIAGRSFREQADFERDKLPEKSVQERLRDLRMYLGRFYFSENALLGRFFECQAVKTRFSGPLGQGLLRLNTLSWYVVLSLGFLAFCAPAFPTDHNYLVPLVLKGLVFLVMMQPVLGGAAHGRYYVVFIPVFSLLFSLTLRASPRMMMLVNEYKRFSPHSCLLLAGQALALFVGVANVWIFLSG